MIAAFGLVTGVAFATHESPPASRRWRSDRSWDGVFTDDQASRGEAQYGRMCELCHGADLSGNPVDEIPALAWDAFLTHWNERT